ncbi:MAG: hypothetical protein IJP98_01080 [Clostridia bacterium]|nr:hypothetical protein [Clostridia bacterium]
MEFLLFPFFFSGLVALFAVLASRARRQQEAAQKAQQKEEQENAANAIPVQKAPAQGAPARNGSLQTHAARPYEGLSSAAPTVTPKAAPTKPIARPSPAATQSMAAYEAVKKQTAVPERAAQSEAQAVPILQWNRNTAVQAVLYSEILGKPKARR